MRFLIHRPDSAPALVPAASVAIDEIRLIDPTDRRAITREWVMTGIYTPEAIALLCAFEARRCHLHAAYAAREEDRETLHFAAEQWDALAEEVRSVTRRPAVSAA